MFPLSDLSLPFQTFESKQALLPPSVVQTLLTLCSHSNSNIHVALSLPVLTFKLLKLSMHIDPCFSLSVPICPQALLPPSVVQTLLDRLCTGNGNAGVVNTDLFDELLAYVLFTLNEHMPDFFKSSEYLKMQQRGYDAKIQTFTYSNIHSDWHVQVGKSWVRFGCSNIQSFSFEWMILYALCSTLLFPLLYNIRLLKAGSNKNK